MSKPESVASPPVLTFGVLFSLYLAEGLPHGVYTEAMGAILRSYHVPISLITIGYMLGFPWALKPLWAPYVDSLYSPRLGQRRSWILPMQALSIVTLVAMALLFDPHSLGSKAGLGVFFLLIMLLNFFSSTQDIASDGLAVRILAVHQRGLGNGIQVAGHRLGLVVGGGVLLFVLGTWGWRASFLGLAGLLGCLMLLVLFYREPPPVAARESRGESMRHIYQSFLARPGMWGWLVVLMVFKSGEAGAAMVKPMLVDMGYSLAQIGLMVSVVGSGCAVLGALIGGWATNRLGRYRAIVGFGFLQALTTAAYGGLSWLHDGGHVIAPWMVYGISALEHFAGGMATVAVLTAIMDFARAEHAGADFTVQVSVFTMFGGLFYMAAGMVAHHLGYTACFGLFSVLALALLSLPVVLCRNLPFQGGGSKLGGDGRFGGQSPALEAAAPENAHD